MSSDAPLIGSDLVAVAALAAGAALAAMTQLPLRVIHQRIHETSEAYLLPPPEHVARMSLGYRAATADVLWANVLVTHGLRLGEQRRHDLAANYIEAINELDPTWREPYRVADSLITLQTKAASIEQVYAARHILERGLRERPTDAELWLIAGVFVGLIVPTSYLEDKPEEGGEWRATGATYLLRAAELAPNDQTILWQAIGGARIFAQNGQFDRAIEMYASILNSTEDPELRERVESMLQTLGQKRTLEEDVVQRRARRHAFDRFRLENYPGATSPGTSVLGYPRDAAQCAGATRSTFAGTSVCSKSWREWAELEPFGGLSPDDLK
ncbi:MAG: hypothetical protein U0271_48340 [Polyangiaceae bacterium]